ncbi:MAG: tetratricopeptide repeat protein [Aquificae bacterium]|nr:tetratricopeptide repeat protein [Aquificota bacterium]
MRKFVALFSLFFFSMGNFYEDALFCAYFQDRPQTAKKYCLRALEKNPSPELYEDTIKVLLRLKEYATAEEVAREFLEMFPDRVEPYLSLYHLYKFSGKEDKALQIIEKAYEQFPHNRQVILFLTDEYLKRKEFKRAEKLLREFIKNNPDVPLPYYLLGRIYLLQGRSSEGIRYLQKALEVQEHYTPAVLSLGKFYEEKRDFTKAEELYREVLEEDPDNAVILEKLGKLYIASNRIREAKKIYEKLLQISPENPNYQHEYVLILLNLGEFKRAREILSRLYARFPNNPNITFTYALTLELTGDLERAKELYEQLLTLFPNNAKVIERLAGVYLDLGEYESAKNLIEKGKVIEPDNVNFRFLEADYYLKKGEYEKALSVLNKIQEEYPEDYRVFFMKAIVYDYMGKYREAEEKLRKAMELNPSDPDLYNHLGYSLLLWYGKERIEEAEDLIRKALEMEPNNPAFLDSMGWVYFLKGEYEKAIQYLLRALREVYDDPVVNEHVGDVLVKMNFRDTARNYYRKALEMLEKGKHGEKGQKERILEKLKNL